MKKLLYLFLFTFCLLFPQKTFAVSISIVNAPGSVSSDPFTVEISILGASTGQNYLRADLYKDGTSNYFGETFNGSSWYGGSTGTSYLPINITDSKTTASASLQVRIGTPTSTEFSGVGSYKLKIRRYTSSGNAASSDDESPVNLTINYQVPGSPTPTSKNSISTGSTNPTGKTTLAKTPTPTKVPTAPKAASTSSGSSVTSSGPEQVVNNSDKIASDFARVQNPSPTVGKTGEVSVLGDSKKEIPFMQFLVGGGILLVIGGGIFAFNNKGKIKIWMENL